MVTSSASPVEQALRRARKAYRQKDFRAAYDWAKRAAQTAPELEEPWLILAAVSKPEASLRFLTQALKINPDSAQAQKGMAWARRRLSAQREQPQSPRAQTPPRKPRRLIPALLTIFVVGVLGWTAWSAGKTPALALPGEAPTPTASATDQYWAQVDLAKPTYTLTPTATFTPTPTFTATPTPTLTPTPTYTASPTNTPSLTPTTKPTNTPQPAPTIAPPAEIGGGEHWIEVNLSEQKVYAYAGTTLVNSFIVSTGTWQHPTVTGIYHIYMRFRYTDMSGPGYYLRDVPYTMYFYKGYALHGTYWHSNFGTPMSHGCVNLSIPDSGWLFNFAKIGTMVSVHY